MGINKMDKFNIGDDFMKIHLRKGFTLVLVIFVLAILMILATFTLTFMVNENRYAIYHENATKAEYIAMNGADVVEAALVSHLRTLFGQKGEGIKDINAYLDSLKDTKKEVGFSSKIEGLEKVEISLTKINGMDVLAIDSYANYNGVGKSVRKIMWSEYVKSTKDGTYYQGLPLIAKNEAYRVIDKNPKDYVDLTEKSGDKKATYDVYAQKMGDSSVFLPFDFAKAPTPTWSGDMQTETINISGDITENKFYNGNVLVNGELKIDGGVNISIRGNLTINANVKKSLNTGNDINFYIYNEGNQEAALIIEPPQDGEVNANFYVNIGKTVITLKKATLTGDIVSNDSFSGSLVNGYPNQNDYNVKITADDSSKKIDFDGSIYAPNAYVIVGGSIDPNDMNVINHKGVIIGSYIEIDGKNEKKDYDYLDEIYRNSTNGIELPVGNPTEFNILNFKSYYIDY